MRETKLLAVLLALALCVGLLGACGSASNEPEISASAQTSESPAAETVESEEPSTSAASSESPETESTAPAEESAPAEEVETAEAWVYEPLSYPLDAGDLELELWVIMDLSPDQIIGDWNEHPLLPLVKEWTGVGLYINAQSQANGTERTNLMLASRDYPDLIGGFSYTAGISAAIEDEIIIELRDYLPTYAPDYWKLLTDDGGYNLKGVATDDGEIGVFAAIANGSRGPTDGLMTRMNWFEEQNLEIPSTFDEATEVLKALSVAYGLKNPLYMTGDGVLDQDQLSASFGVALKFDSITGQGGFYIGEDGSVKFGYCEQGYIDYVTQIKAWYDEGIISRDFTSNPTDYRNEELIEQIMAGETAIFSRGDGLIDLFRNVSGDDIQAIPDFTINEGDQIHLGNPEVVAAGTTGLVITTGCEEPELAMQFINWWYTDEGQRASIYGIEGVSYELDESGTPQYTEMMTSTPERTLSSMKMDYCGIISLRTDGLTPEASYSEYAQEAPVIWGSNKDGLYEIPDGVTMTVDEGDEFSKYFADLSTYCQEMTCKFITGAEPLEEIEAFQQALWNMGVQECCDIYEAAIVRYNAR